MGIIKGDTRSSDYSSFDDTQEQTINPKGHTGLQDSATPDGIRKSAA